mgnify:CR=1 FL=1
MGRFVIAAYRAKPGHEDALRRELRDHLPVLRREGLVTDRPAYLMQAKDGTVLEVFEWVSSEAIERAHGNPAVLELWARFEAVCEYVAPAEVEEVRGPFSEFAALEP